MTRPSDPDPFRTAWTTGNSSGAHVHYNFEPRGDGEVPQEPPGELLAASERVARVTALTGLTVASVAALVACGGLVGLAVRFARWAWRR